MRHKTSDVLADPAAPKLAAPGTISLRETILRGWLLSARSGSTVGETTSWVGIAPLVRAALHAGLADLELLLARRAPADTDLDGREYGLRAT